MGFWSANLPIGVSYRKLGEYCNKPWLLHSAELVHLFGGASGSDCNVLLLGLVEVMVLCMIGYFILLI